MNNIESLVNLKRTVGLVRAQNEYHHNNMDQRLKIEVLTIGSWSELLIKTGRIMKKRVMRKNMFDRKGNGVQEVWQEARKEGCNT